MIRSLLTPRRRLTVVLGAVAVLALGGGIARAALDDSGSGPKPPPRSLGNAVLSAVQSVPSVEGVSARIRFTNRLIPPGTLPKGAKLPLGAGADGRLWLSRDGGLRLDLRSDAGDVEITAADGRATLYDASSKTLFRMRLPEGARAPQRGTGLPLGDLASQLGPLLAMWNVSGATPSNTAGRPSYTVRISPKDDGGLLGAAELSWDAARGVPLRAAVYEQGSKKPVLELAATDIDFGRVPAADLAARPHPGARVVDVEPDRAGPSAGHEPAVSGVAAVRRRLGFPLAAPDELAGLPRRSVHLVRTDDGPAAVSIYGRGLGAIVVFQERERRGTAGPLGRLSLPTVNVDGRTGTELATALGTVVTFARDGVRYVVAGSVPPVAAENAARELK